MSAIINLGQKSIPTVPAENRNTSAMNKFEKLTETFLFGPPMVQTFAACMLKIREYVKEKFNGEISEQNPVSISRDNTASILLYELSTSPHPASFSQSAHWIDSDEETDTSIHKAGIEIFRINGMRFEIENSLSMCPESETEQDYAERESL